MRILMTGTEGLIGQELQPLVEAAGFEVICVDNRASQPINTRDSKTLAPLVEECDGIVHLAAVSRVVWGEQDPITCREVNVEATRRLIDMSEGRWFLFASSREVYGQQDRLPVTEDAPLRPMNVYARSKVAGEEIVHAYGGGIVRLSNVFGRTDDHVDRVIPAFCRAAIEGRPLRIDGRGHTFDFTYVKDVADGILRVILKMARGEKLPPIHFTSGRGTTLGEAAEKIVALAGSDSPLVEAPPRSFDVESFIGDNTRAKELLDWTPTLSFKEGASLFLNELAVPA